MHYQNLTSLLKTETEQEQTKESSLTIEFNNNTSTDLKQLKHSELT